MGYSSTKFLSLPERSRAKKLADLLRVILLRLGNDWKQAIHEYDQLVLWNLGPPHAAPFQLGQNLQHARVLDLYQNWRELAGLGAERDVYLQQDPGDATTAASTTLSWSVLAHNLRSAYNVGSILRSMDCFGLETLHLSGYTPALDHVALKSAARGSETWMQTQRWESPLLCIEAYQTQNLPVIALETGTDAKNLFEYAWPSKGLIILGNEELGIAPELLELCSQKLFIPMHGRKASLNVASAFAITAATLRNFLPLQP